MCNEKLDMDIDIKKVPMVRITWLDARDMETGWLEMKDIFNNKFIDQLSLTNDFLTCLSYCGNGCVKDSTILAIIVFHLVVYLI